MASRSLVVTIGAKNRTGRALDNVAGSMEDTAKTAQTATKIATKGANKQRAALKKLVRTADELKLAKDQLRNSDKLTERQQVTLRNRVGKLRLTLKNAAEDYREIADAAKEAAKAQEAAIDAQAQRREIATAAQGLRTRPQRAASAVGGVIGQLDFTQAKKEIGDLFEPTNALTRSIAGLHPAGRVAAVGIDGLTKAASFGLTVYKATALGVGVLSTAIFALTKRTAESTQEIVNQARNLGFSVESYSALATVTRQFGASQEDLESTLGDITQRAINIPADFERWGIATKNVNGTLKTSEELLRAVADRVQTASSRTEQFALVDELAGDAGRRLIDVLAGGSDGLDRLIASAREMGGVIDGASVAINQNFTRSLRRAETQLAATGRQAGESFMPAVTFAMDAVVQEGDRLLKSIFGNRDAMEELATKTVAVLARSFAGLLDITSALSQGVEGVASIFTFRLGPAFEKGRELAKEAALSARLVAQELESGAALTQDKVIPSVQQETAARGTLVEQLKGERGARVSLREQIQESIADLTELDALFGRLGDAGGEDARVVRDALEGQVATIRTLRRELADAVRDRKTSIAIARVAGTVEAEEAAKSAQERERSIRSQLGETLKAQRRTVSAAQELTAILQEELRKREEAERLQQERAQERLLNTQNTRLELLRMQFERERQLKKENQELEAQSEAARFQQTQQLAQQTSQVVVGAAVRGTLAVIRGNASWEESLLSVGNAIIDLGAAILTRYLSEQIAIGVTSAIQATADVATAASAKASAVSQVNAASAIGAANAIAAWAGVPIAGPALGAAQAAAVVAQIQATALPLLALNQGGEVPGAGNRDTVPALLTPGEVVVPAPEVRRQRADPPEGRGDAHVHIHTTMLDRTSTEMVVDRWLSPRFRAAGFSQLRA